jgi:hypothetical protein
MKSKVNYLFKTGLGLLLVALSSASVATSRMGKAQVKEVSGQPCFSLASEEFKRGSIVLMGIFVSDETTKPVQRVWAYTVNKKEQGTPMQPEVCIPYGQHPADVQLKPAEQLVPGRIYRAFLQARPSEPTDPTFGYSAKFCVKQTTKTATFSVHPILWDEKSSRWNDDVCK